MAGHDEVKGSSDGIYPVPLRSADVGCGLWVWAGRTLLDCVDTVLLLFGVSKVIIKNI